ncbi:branched-chain amino acid ABC transporter permease [Variovorax sp. LjRoot290]|uniref:branched-chain amino acid ABC transporter permease n=1 Tax=Variovorax sp. LjRoot290 TaxID=3342316 RepID=UPI003ECD0CAA
MKQSTFALFWVMGVTALVVAPFVVYPVFLMQLLCFALFACAFNLLLGYAGLLSFGHAAFFASSAYVTAHTVKVLGFSPLAGLAAGIVVAMLLGALMGLVAIRRQGIYFAMITLALAQLVYFYFMQSPWTGAEDGIQGVPRGTLFGVIDLESNLAMYYVVAAASLGGFALIHRTVNSHYGEVLKAIRDNEPRAVSLGYDVDRYKLLAFVMSAALAGLAGSLKVLALQLASINDAHWHASGQVILMALMGGLGTSLGPVVGAALMTGMHHYLAGIGSWLMVITGVIFVFVVMVFRRGIVGTLMALPMFRSRSVVPPAPGV